MGQRKYTLDYFSDMPVDLKNEELTEWVANATPFINYLANIGSHLREETKKREDLMLDMAKDVKGWSGEFRRTLLLLREIRGEEWKRNEHHN